MEKIKKCKICGKFIPKMKKEEADKINVSLDPAFECFDNDHRWMENNSDVEGVQDILNLKEILYPDRFES